MTATSCAMTRPILTQYLCHYQGFHPHFAQFSVILSSGDTPNSRTCYKDLNLGARQDLKGHFLHLVLKI
jgi:hypothetical protein